MAGEFCRAKDAAGRLCILGDGHWPPEAHVFGHASRRQRDIVLIRRVLEAAANQACGCCNSDSNILELRPEDFLEGEESHGQEALAASPCRLCAGVIGPDITGRPMCYDCGPLDMAPREQRTDARQERARRERGLL
jgi:hypothetical protein